jgi:hypothetical protein
VWEVAPALEVEVYEVRITGVKPLLMHRPYLLSMRTRRRSEILSPEEEARNALYTDGDLIVIPSLNIKAMLRDAGRNYKIPQRQATYGAYIKAGIDIEPSPNVPLLNPKTNQPYRVSRREWTIDIRPVVIKRNRILRARPRFDEWALQFRILNLDPGLLKADILKQILVDAGKFYGLGDFRPEFGRFMVEKFEIVRV